MSQSGLPPLRPLSAYNFFFRDERERILGGYEEEKVLLNKERRHKLLLEQWGRDRTKKRLHRKTHGKISFKELGQRISASWKGLKECERAFYREIAATDMARFKREMKASGNQQQ